MSLQEEKNVAVVQRFFDGFNTQDRQVVASTLAQNFFFADLDAGSFLDLEFAYFNSFPDLTYTVHALFGSGNLVTSRWSFIGTHKGKGGPGVFEDAEPTGIKVDVPGIGIARVEDGKIVRWWGQWNAISLHRQLGTLALLAE